MDTNKPRHNDERVTATGDSDGAQEDLSTPKAKLKSRTKKRKRSSSESSRDEVLPENIVEMEKSLCAAAIKNNLDETSVKKILKKVVTNDHVLAYVKLREEEEDSGPDEGKMKPKLTRAKVKELMKGSPGSAPWNLDNIELTPIKHIPVKTRPEVTALIAHDLPDEEDDDEYHPTLDDAASDDDHTCSDLDSQPRTPATPQSMPSSSPRVLRDGPFKVPDASLARRRLQIEEEEATIALRTRSKLSLSSTPIEHIESSFVPPDEVPLPIVDDLWNQFLEECLNPASASRNEDDDEADPEYNVAADPDAHEEDEEALESSIIKISKKELNDLVTELFHIMPEDLEGGKDIQNNIQDLNNSTDCTVQAPPVPSFPLPLPFKKEPLSDDEGGLVIANGGRRDSCLSVGKTEDVDLEGEDTRRVMETRKRKSVDDVVVSTPKSTSVQIEFQDADTSVKQPATKHQVPPVLQKAMRGYKFTCIQVPVGSQGDEPKMLPEQVLILQQQLRQHIQLATSNFLQLCVHPVFWDFAPPFKEYLETFEKVVQKNPKSVADVCNLKPALELVRSWESSVSQNTPENVKMVKFLQGEIEKCRKRYSQNSVYFGNFHESYKQVVANSSVFLYPYLLPPVPYRSNTTRRAGYLRSEDELIALGLDQFWRYIEANPQIYKKDQRYHPQNEKRSRWGLTKAVELVCRYMFPFFQPRVLHCHINFVRTRSPDTNNPIFRFLRKGEVTPVKHRLLPFNPNINLYEQPEIEMPLMWTKYISKSSKRAKEFLKRKLITNGIQPKGISVDLGEKIATLEKRPLPPDFTRKITCKRKSLKPPAPKKNNSIEVEISPLTPLPEPMQINPSPVANKVENQPVPVAKIFTIVTQPNGSAILLPLEMLAETTTVTSMANPITTPAVVNATNSVPKDPITETVDPNKPTTEVDSKHFTKEIENDEQKKPKEGDAGTHCKCCSLLNEIVKKRQKTITEYFRSQRVKVECPCSKIKSPKVTNRLRALLRNFQSQFYGVWRAVDAKLRNLELRLSEKGGGEMETCSLKEFEPNADDNAFATSFHLKLQYRLAPSKHARQKQRTENLLTHFNVDADSPLWLANQLKGQLDNELADLYRDFAGFLTADQADRVGAFRDYFVGICVPEFVRAVEREVKDEAKKHQLLYAMRDGLNNSRLSSCDLCQRLLVAAKGYSELAGYIFTLFPHRRKDCVVPKSSDQVTSNSPQRLEERNRLTTEQSEETNNCSQSFGDYEADHSSSGEDEATENDTSVANNKAAALSENRQNTLMEHCNSGCVRQNIDEHGRVIEGTTSATHRAFAEVKREPEDNVPIDTPELTISKTEVQEHEPSDMSLMIMSEDESVKTEPSDSWKKDEDKIILVAIQTIAGNDHADKKLELNEIYQTLSEQLLHRSMDEIRDRVSYLLELITLVKS